MMTHDWKSQVWKGWVFKHWLVGFKHMAGKEQF